jgi:DNA-binding HxlR family transcriptional regulator
MGHRSYGQYCPIAAALEAVGDRWTLLIMRELLIGDRRFTDLRTALPGLAPNLLAERLRILQADGLVERKELAPPAARTVYSATSDGRSVVPVLQALARFGATRLGPPRDVDVRPAMAVYGMLTPFHRPEPAGARFHARLELDGETFDVVTDGARLSTRERADTTPDVTITARARDLVAARQGSRPLAANADADGPGLARFARLFGLD